MDTYTKQLRDRLLNEVVVFGLIQHYKIDKLRHGHLETPHGIAEYKEWDKTFEISAPLVEDELREALFRFREQTQYTVARLIGDDILAPYHAVPFRQRVPLHIKQDSHQWILMASPETWLWLQSQTIAEFRPNILDDKYYYDGISCVRSHVDKDIFVNVKESGIWNLQASLGDVKYIKNTDSYQIKVKVLGYFLLKLMQADSD